jgi:hypothetical protein
MVKQNELPNLIMDNRIILKLNQVEIML